jgi:hypothetical protein
VVAIPDIAMATVRRLVDRGTAGRELSTGKFYTRLAMNQAVTRLYVQEDTDNGNSQAA